MSAVLSTHVTHYGPWSGFLYYNMTISIERASLTTYENTNVRANVTFQIEA